MAILRGFPPSNTLQIDSPMAIRCDICAKTFHQSFPLSLSLRIDNDANFGILPCHECYEKDQGRKYWVPDLLNRWGDDFSVYSPVREGVTTSEIKLAEERRFENYKARRKLRTNCVRLNQRDTISDRAMHNRLVSSVTHYRIWTNWGHDNVPVPKTLRLWCGKPVFDMMVASLDCEDRVFSRDDWTWIITLQKHMPDESRRVFLEELKN